MNFIELNDSGRITGKTEPFYVNANNIIIVRADSCGTYIRILNYQYPIYVQESYDEVVERIKNAYRF